MTVQRSYDYAYAAERFAAYFAAYAYGYGSCSRQSASCLRFITA